MTKLNVSGGQALRDWVRRGGHLVVSVGSDWSRIRDSFLLALERPDAAGVADRPGADQRPWGAESFAGATKPITPPGAAPVLVTKLDEVEARGGKVLIGASGHGSPGRPGCIRFGRVTVVALDVDQNPFAIWEDRPLFWVRAPRPPPPGSDDAPPPTPGSPGVGTTRTASANLSTQLRKALEQFRGVTLIPFAGLLLHLPLHIADRAGDYLFSKVLKRMELTWITFPTIVVTVSVLAYYAAMW